MKPLALAIFFISFTPFAIGQTSIGKQYNIPGFIQINDTLFISKTEVSIRDYAKFLLYLKQTIRDTIKLQNCLPNPNFTDWTLWSSFSEKLITFDDYLFSIKDTTISFTSFIGDLPIVNISKTQAADYCKFKSWDYQLFYVNLKNGKKKAFPDILLFRLPTAEEWTSIARTPLEKSTIICKDYFSTDTTGELLPISVYKGALNSLEIYNVTGNVAELVSDNENVYGGSFKESIDDCNSTSSRIFKAGDNATGFRIVAVIR